MKAQVECIRLVNKFILYLLLTSLTVVQDHQSILDFT